MVLSNKQFINEIYNKDKAYIDVIIGLNGTGKTYLLSSIKHKYNLETLLINSEGLSAENQRRKIDRDAYRGSNRTQVEVEESLKINLDKFKINEMNLSNGQKKINNIIECLEYYSLYKEIILLDEPDVHLDTQLIIRLVDILNILVNEHKMCVIIVTHNSNLLELLNISIDNIYIKKDINKLVHTTSDIIYDRYLEILNSEKFKIFKNTINTFGECNKIHQNMSRFMMKYNNSDLTLLNQSIWSLTHYSRFYDSLFFDYVILFEGATESEVMKYYTKNEGFINHNIMFSKERSILYTCIYKELEIDTVLVLDRDIGINEKSGSKAIYNNELCRIYNELTGKHIIFLTRNIEEELGITKSSHETKDVVMAYQISNNDTVKNNLKALVDKIIKDINRK